MVELFSTMLVAGCMLFLSFLILRLTITLFYIGVDKFFDQTDDGDDEEEYCNEKGDENDASLAVLNYRIGHGFKT
jgi:hypothetical protein